MEPDQSGPTVVPFLLFWFALLAASVYLLAQEKAKIRSAQIEQLELARRDPETGPRTVATPPVESQAVE